MTSLAEYLASCAYNNAWANHRLLTACGKLSQAEFVAPRVSFFPSLVATLNHIVTVDWYYVDALERARRDEPVNPEGRSFFAVDVPFESCAELHAAQRAVDRRLIAVCLKLDPALPVAIPRASSTEIESAVRLLGHLFQHQIHHRGQAHAMLAGTTVAPPPLDEFFCANEAHLRAKELAELGYTEAEIFR